MSAHWRCWCYRCRCLYEYLGSIIGYRPSGSIASSLKQRKNIPKQWAQHKKRCYLRRLRSKAHSTSRLSSGTRQKRAQLSFTEFQFYSFHYSIRCNLSKCSPTMTIAFSISRFSMQTRKVQRMMAHAGEGETSRDKSPQTSRTEMNISLRRAFESHRVYNSPPNRSTDGDNDFVIKCSPELKRV